MNTLGERLQYIRKKNGYTQESLADLIGVSRGVIFNLEKNKTEPQAIVINALCQNLKIQKDWLLNGIGDIEAKSELSQNAKNLVELFDILKEFSEEEQLYILDMAKTFKKLVGKR